MNMGELEPAAGAPPKSSTSAAKVRGRAQTEARRRRRDRTASPTIAQGFFEFWE